MPVESVTYISDLVATNPIGATDPKSQGDDHIRNIKAAILATFPSVTGAVTATHTNLNVLAGTTNDRVVRVTGGAVNLGQLTAGMFPSTVVPDAALSSNVPLKNAKPVFTGNNSSLTGGAVQISAGIPALNFNETDRDTDEKNWSWIVNNGDFRLTTSADATPGTVVATPISVVRGTGTAVATIALTATNITLNSVNVTDFARLSQGNTYTSALQQITATDARFEVTGSGINGRFHAGSADDTLIVGTTTADSMDLMTNGLLRFRTDASGNYNFRSGTVTTSNASASEVGYKGVPRVSKTADYTIAATDSGTELVLTSAADDITVQASGAPVEGSVVFVENNTGGSVDILQGSGMTLTLDGTSTTGSRTLAANGRAYIRFTSSSTARVGGPGVA